MRFRFNYTDFEEICDKKTAEKIARHANEVYYEYIFQQPQLFGILTTNETFMGFDDHQGEYDNWSGYLVEGHEYKNEHV